MGSDADILAGDDDATKARLALDVGLPDDATMAWNKRCIADGTEGLPVVDTVATP